MAEPVEELEAPSRLEAVELSAADASGLRGVLAPDAWERLEDAGAETARLLRGRRLWHINSTAAGGGVAELLSWWLPLLAAFGVDVRWLVLTAPDAFFELTKRIHHLLHENPRPLEDGDRDAYEYYLAGAARQLQGMIRPGDAVVVHDPQPAALVPVLAGRGATAIWRCHVGTDRPGPHARMAQGFLRPYVEGAAVLVFSRAAFVWPELPAERVRVIQPAIDPLAPKNQPLAAGAVEAILASIGLLDVRAEAAPCFRRPGGGEGRVTRTADILQTGLAPAAAPLVTQVSRWDPLKDPLGVLEGFAREVPAGLGAHLVLAGPAVSAVGDDPEGARVLEAVRERWQALPDAARSRVHIATLPMDDPEENAAMVNALQRASTVVVQKSLSEGFGLTVAEALWKARPVIASRVGGIQEQIEDGVSGVLLDRPDDLPEFGRKVAQVLSDAGLRERLGAAARRRVEAAFLPDRLAADWLDALRRALAP